MEAGENVKGRGTCLWSRRRGGERGRLYENSFRFRFEWLRHPPNGFCVRPQMDCEVA